MKRKNISKKLRFEVFKRDKFTCQYCGEKAPDVILEIDHIKPVAKNGSSDILNLITACKSCNAGKSDRVLSDNSVVEKQHKQLSDLQERKEQFEMMINWQKELAKLDSYAVEQLASFWTELTSGYLLNKSGEKDLEKLIQRFSHEKIMEAMRISVKQYVEYKKDKATKESVERAWGKVGGICVMKERDETNPHNKDINYIRGILRNRFDNLDEKIAISLLQKSVKLGASTEEIKQVALEVEDWKNWHTSMKSYIAYLEGVNAKKKSSKQ